MGFDIEASHHEVADGQHEVDFRYADILTAADNVATFRIAVKAIAAKHNLHATFMPKPILEKKMHFMMKKQNINYQMKQNMQLAAC